MQSDVSVTMISNKDVDIDVLASDWLKLERVSNCSFFLTWTWIGNWLKQIDLPFYLVQASINKEIVGLGIIVKSKRKVFGLFDVEQWWLNRTGQEKFDQCWIEENGFLTTTVNKQAIHSALLTRIKEGNSWQEFILGMSDSNTLNQFSVLSPKQHTLLEDKGYSVVYSQIENTYESDVLSRNTRQKLKQSEKLLSKQGELTFHVIKSGEDNSRGSKSSEEKLKHLPHIAKLHIKRWRDTATPSGFMNDYFQQMLVEVVKDDKSQVVYLALNNEPIGYTINITHQGKVYFYLSALTKSSNNKIKLGMLLQQKAIQYYQDNNIHTYDFLAGDARYKNSMSNKSYDQKMVCFYRNNLFLNIEGGLKKLKAMLSGP